MNHLSPTHPNPVKSLSSPESEPPPISVSVRVVIAHARKDKRVFEAAREQSFPANAEALAALPGYLHALVRATGGDAQVELNRLLKLLAQPEPPVEAPLPASACPVPPMCSAPEAETSATEPTLALPPDPRAPAEDYLIPLALPPLS